MGRNRARLIVATTALALLTACNGGSGDAISAGASTETMGHEGSSSAGSTTGPTGEAGASGSAGTGSSSSAGPDISGSSSSGSTTSGASSSTTPSSTTTTAGSNPTTSSTAYHPCAPGVVVPGGDRDRDRDRAGGTRSGGMRPGHLSADRSTDTYSRQLSFKSSSGAADDGRQMARMLQRAVPSSTHLLPGRAVRSRWRPPPTVGYPGHDDSAHDHLCAGPGVSHGSLQQAGR